MTRRDHILRLGRSLIQHGPLSDRVYIMRLDPDEAGEIKDEALRLARQNGYGKIFAKVPKSLLALFRGDGFETEAVVPCMFPSPHAHGDRKNKREHGCFMARFLAPERATETDPQLALTALRLAGAKARTGIPDRLPEGWEISPLAPDDAEELARLYDNTFATYPFPINDPAHLREAMAGDCDFFGLRTKERLAAAGSCETDTKAGHVEMTDLAAQSDARGEGAAVHLLGRMERDMRKRGLHVAFSISRALSIPANISFSRSGYTYAGTLVNNTNIAGSLESMNVWFKALQ